MNLASPAAQAERRLAIWLALVAGYVDAYSLHAFSTYVSFMSGNTTQTGFLIGQGKITAAVTSAVAIIFFLAGSFGGTWLLHLGLQKPRTLLFGLISVLLVVVIGATRFGVLNAKVGIGALSLAMGLVNPALSRVGAEPVSLTFVTGSLNKIGSHLAMGFRGVPLKDAQGTWDTQLRRAGIMASVWGGFFSGAIISTVVTSRLEVWALLAPLFMLVGLALSSAVSPKTA